MARGEIGDAGSVHRLPYRATILRAEPSHGAPTGITPHSHDLLNGDRQGIVDPRAPDLRTGNDDLFELAPAGADPLLAPVTDEAELARVADRYGLQAPYLLTIGTLQPRKNLERLVEAFAASAGT